MSEASDRGPTSERADLLDGFAVLLRRWWVVLPVVIVTAFLAYRVSENTATEYSQTTSLGIVTPSVITTKPQRTLRDNGGPLPVTTETNALTESGGSTLVANLVVLALQQDEVARAVDAAAPGAAFTAAVVDRDNNQGQLPVLALSVQAATPEAAEAAIGAVRNAAASTTRAVQSNAGVPEDRLATSYVLQAQASPDAVVIERTRATASVAVAGLVVAVVLATIADALLRRLGRRGRRQVSGDHRARHDDYVD